MLQRYYLFFVFLLTQASGTLFAQLQVTPNNNALQLVNTIVGPGFTVTNIKFNCPALASGTFVRNNSNIGMPNGILLTTGEAAKAVGPNNSPSAGTNNGTAGDVDLDSIANFRTYDACALEFDLEPACDTFQIRYVFASEEYLEYVGSTFNDVFAFLISGPGIPGKVNLAQVNGKNVSVNTINPNTNPNLYVNNPQGNNTTIQYDGFTRVLTAKQVVSPCEIYHLKLAIADVDDGIFDAGIFIEGGSIQCSPVVYSDLGLIKDPMEGCNSGSFTFCRTGDSSQQHLIPIRITGTATNGVDYKLLPDTVVIPAGKKCHTITVEPIDDGVYEPPETIKIFYKRSACPLDDSLELIISDPLPFDAGPNKVICPGDTTRIGVLPSAGYNYTWAPVTGMFPNNNISNPYITLTNNTQEPITYHYTVSVISNSNCILKDSVSVTVRPQPVASFSLTGACTNSPIKITDLSEPVGTGGVIRQWYWNFGNNLYDTIKNPSPQYPNPGTYPVTLKVTDNFGCTDDTTKTVDIYPLPKADFTAVNACEGDSVTFNSLSTVNPGNITTTIWSFGDGSGLESGTPIKHLYPKAGTYSVQLIVTTNWNCVHTITKVIEVYPRPVIDFKADPVCVNGVVRFLNSSTADYFTWTLGDGTTSTSRNPKNTYTVPGTKTIKLVGTTKYGCTDSITKPLEVHPQPIADFVMNGDSGCAPLCVNFEDKTTLTSPDTIISWRWMFNDGLMIGPKTFKHCFNQNDEITPGLIVTSNHGCIDTIIKTTKIKAYPKPTAAFTISPSITSVYDPIVTIKDASGEYKLYWNFGDGSSDSIKTIFQHTYPEPGTYTVTQIVVNQWGCRDTIIHTLRVDPETTVFVPNAFTPDDNGINDDFFPKVSGYLLDANFVMYIYDRWGNKIFTSDHLSKHWNGRANGGIELAQQDVYMYLIIFTDKETDEELRKLIGHVTLVR